MFKHKGIHRPGKEAAAKRAGIPVKKATLSAQVKGIHRSSPDNVLKLLKRFGGKKK